jgi:hypothetical protein
MEEYQFLSIGLQPQKNAPGLFSLLVRLLSIMNLLATLSTLCMCVIAEFVTRGELYFA